MDRTITVPADVKKRLDELVASLRATLGDDLRAVVAHGSAVRGEYRPGESDVDLLIVLARDPFEQLAALGAHLELARFSARIEAMILRADEIAAAADCFPLLYADIARTGVVLAGTDPFAGVQVEPHHLRLRIEQELREARIRLRRLAADLTDTSGDSGLGGAIEHKVKQLRSPLRALLALRGESAPESLWPVLEGIGRAYEVDLGPLRAAREAPRAAWSTLATLLDRALADVDQREVRP
jgi:predicted nucleotidyltransferase